ncbi:eukaryotic translation initiation factor 3 subunit A [Tieghemiomyces parasiticus]|uniref:Eukaryotic translation initiation factor 3 subunit A n=1 Tax=Tieghemiomyces parasiticus TaxID=78921 RepID=A0A9W8A046_9FUNG|nr:eukaryotic translation initiation factor 3 subunit A [Tieghemiomyces parasiticus]
MAPVFVKPENALSKSNDLLAVGQKEVALTTLKDVLISKRTRGTPVSVLEPIMLRLITICVADRRGQDIKDALQNYRNMCQNTNVNTIGTVVMELLSQADAKVQAAQAKANQITVGKLEDLEATESPESILMSAVSDEQDKDRTDRGIVTPWLKFLWESYRNVLDTLRNNARLETIYQAVANQALTFCLKFERKNEFRRLCEKLRTHLAAIVKSGNQTHGVNLQDPESLQRHTELRYGQLHVATELELWQEAFRSIEDIHILLASSKRLPKPSLLVNYYEKLTRIMTVSGNQLFHAAAWHKYYETVRLHAKNIEAKDLERIATNVVLATMAVPIIDSSLRVATMDVDENKVRDQRLGGLLGLTHAPKRATLIADLTTAGVLAKVSPALRAFYSQMEEKFHPLSICRTVSPFLVELSAHPEQGKYVKALQVCMVTRLFQQLSQVYTVIKMDHLKQLVDFPAPLSYGPAQLERFIVNGCRRGEFPLRVDYRARTIHFTSDVFGESAHAAASGPQLQPTPADQVRGQLSHLARGLQALTRAIEPQQSERQVEARVAAVATALHRMKEEHERVMQRKAVIERRKEIIETLNARREKEEAREKALNVQRELEAERTRLAEETRRREVERLERERDAIAKEEARRLAESLKAKGGLQVDEEDLARMNKDTLMELQVEQLEKSKQEQEERGKAASQQLDFMHRAYRLEEIPLLEKDYERQRKADRAFHEAAAQHQLETSRQAHAEGLVRKAQMGRMLPSYQGFKAKLESRRSEELQRLKAKLAAKIAAEKKYRVEEYHRLCEQERARKEAEEAERVRREEEERRRKEEEAQLEAERLEREAAAREAEAERIRHLDEMAVKQRAREAEVAARQEARRLERLAEASATNKFVPSFRRAGATATPSASYVPPTAGAPTRPAATESTTPAYTELRRSANAWRPRGAASSPSAGGISPPVTTPTSASAAPPSTTTAGAARPSRPSPFGEARPVASSSPSSTVPPKVTPTANSATAPGSASSPSANPSRYVPPSMRNKNPPPQ